MFQRYAREPSMVVTMNTAAAVAPGPVLARLVGVPETPAPGPVIGVVGVGVGLGPGLQFSLVITTSA